ncbi:MULTISPECIES: hypothetical protein [unclassified Streptomyces]|uniref:hypothetical protein n=1 Tax=unclassified Streptomyces TaxID=2593676 RepID=UPI0036664F19
MKLRPDEARHVAEHLTPADPGRPWAGVKFAAAWGRRDILGVTVVRPDRPFDHVVDQDSWTTEEFGT